MLHRSESHNQVRFSARTNRRHPKRDLLYRPQAFHNDSAPQCRHDRQCLPLASFPPADLAQQIATDSATSSSLKHRRLDLPSNLLVSSFGKLGSSHSPPHPADLTRSCNGLAITILDGKELSWICLGSCSIDISINALVVYAVTVSPAAPAPSGPLCHGGRPQRRRPRPPKRRTGRPDLSSVSVQVTQEVQVDDEGEPFRPLCSSPALLPSPPPTVGGQGTGKWRTSHPFNLTL